MGPVVDFDEVRAEGLGKSYGRTRALVGVDLVLASGSLTCVLGPNGSGKSTLLRLLAGLTRPTRGTLRYGAHDARTARARIGLLAHGPLLYPDLSGRENLAFTAEAYGLPSACVDAAIAAHRLEAFADRETRTYSRGQLQRTSLARALLPSPRLLLLDEPTTGLDAESVESLVATLARVRDEGAIVAVITHDEGALSRLAPRRVRLERGRLVPAEGPATTPAEEAP